MRRSLLLTAALLFTTALLSCTAALLPGSAAAEETVLQGQASVVDGDTVVIHDDRVRLFGIDTPESAQSCNGADGVQYRCGQQAALALSDKIAGRTVRCAGDERDPFGRLVGVCEAGGEDLNRWMVRRGWALAFRKYSERYVADEDAARADKVGLWAGTFVEPWEWRSQQRASRKAANAARGGGAASGGGASTGGADNGGADNGGAAAAKATTGAPPPTPGCAVKGNVSSKGARIYHLPGGPGYDGTKISPDKGERWFCSAEEAEAAGWRAAHTRH